MKCPATRPTRSSRRRPRPALERLESRALLSGIVSLRLSGGSLFIDGDRADNAISLRPGSSPGEVQVIGLDGTTIVGPASVKVTKDVHIRLNGGDDILNVGGEESHEESGTSVAAEEHEAESRLELPGNLLISTADGTDRVTVRFTTIHGSLSIDTAANHSAKASLETDNNIVTLGRGPTFRDHSDEGHTTVSIAGADSDDEGEGDGGPPPDLIIGESVNIRTGTGDDRIKVAFADIGAALSIDAGPGVDYVVTGRGPIAGEHGSGGSGGSGGEGGGGHGGRQPDLLIGSTMRVTTDAGADFVMLRNTRTDRLDVSTGADGDALGLQNVKVEAATALDTFQGDDVIAILDCSFNGRFTLRTGTDSDQVWIEGTDFNSSTSLDGGPGVNHLYLDAATDLDASLSIRRFITTHSPEEVSLAWDLVLDLFGPFLQGR